MDLIIESMLGKKIKSGVKYKTKYDIKRDDVPILEVRDMDLGGKDKISFKVWAGEVIGLIGLMGAGQVKIVKSIFGILPDIDKKIFVSGKSIIVNKPESSLKSEDNLSLTFNSSMFLGSKTLTITYPPIFPSIIIPPT